MSAVLSTPRLPTFQSARRPETAIGPEPHASGAGLVQLLCGGGLIVYGLLRGSWPGLTLAAVGGFLVYRGLSSPPVAPVDQCPLPPQDDLRAGPGGARTPSVLLPPTDHEAWLGRDGGEA